MLKPLTFAIAGISAVYSGYWFVGANAVERAAAGAVEDLRADGWLINFDDLSTRGFPNRFDTIAENPRIASPDGGFSWDAEAFGLYALSYRPNSVIALLPQIQHVAAAGQDIDITTTAMKASAQVQPALGLPLDHLTAETGPFSAISSAGWTLGMDHALAAFRISGPAANAYDLYFKIDAPVLDGVGDGLTFDLISMEAQVILDAPLDRNSAAPAIVALTLRDARMELGTAHILATGEISFAPDGLGSGEISITASEWEQLARAIESSGLISAEGAAVVRNTLSAMAAGATGFTAPITITDGVARLGFLPIGMVQVAPRTAD